MSIFHEYICLNVHEYICDKCDTECELGGDRMCRVSLCGVALALTHPALPPSCIQQCCRVTSECKLMQVNVIQCNAMQCNTNHCIANNSAGSTGSYIATMQCNCMEQCNAMLNVIHVGTCIYSGAVAESDIGHHFPLPDLI